MTDAQQTWVQETQQAVYMYPLCVYCYSEGQVMTDAQQSWVQETQQAVYMYRSVCIVTARVR